MRGAGDFAKAARSPWFIAWAVVAAFVVAVFGFRSNELDKCYFKAADRLATHGDPYAPTVDTIGLWTYPPGMLLTAWPFSWVPEWLGRVAWGMLLAACTVGSAWCIVRVVLTGVKDERERKRRVIALIVAALLAHQLLLSPLTYFSHDLFIAAALALALLATVRGRELATGAWIGLGAALKVTPGLFAFAFLLGKRWSALAALCVVGAVVTIAPDAIRGDSSGGLVRRFAGIASGAADLSTAGGGYWASWNPLAQNLSATISRWTIETPPGPRDVNERDWSVVHLDADKRRMLTVSASLAVLATVAAVILFTPRRGINSSLARLNECGAVACGMVLLSPHSSNYHFAIEYFAIASCVIMLARTRDRALAAIVAMLVLLGLPSGRDLIGNFAVEVLLIYGKLTIGALVALIGCLRVAILMRREGGEFPSSAPLSPA